MRNKKTSGEEGFNSVICDNLRAARKRVGLSIDDMAKRLDVTPSTVCRIEIGRSSATIYTVCLWSKITGASINALTKGCAL